MDKTKEPSNATMDDIISEAILRERVLMEFYEHIIQGIGPDARSVMSDLYAHHSERIVQLERLRDEVENLREVTGAIAD